MRSYNDLVILELQSSRTALRRIANKVPDSISGAKGADRLEGLEFEALVADLLSTLVRLPAEALDAAIADSLGRVCELLGLEKSSLWQWGEADSRKPRMTHHRRSSRFPMLPERAEEEMPDSWVRREILARREVVLTSPGDKRTAGDRDSELGRRFLGSRSVAAFPLATGDGPVLGAVFFTHLLDERSWSVETLRRLRLLAQIFAVALERKRGEEARADLSRRLIQAHEQERSLLARELHDDVAQRLAVLAIDSGRAELAAAAGPLRDTLRSVREGLVALSEDVHDLSYQLHPSILDEIGLAEAIEAECARFRRIHSARLSAELSGVPDSFGRQESLCLFRVAQEAISNAARHARARHVKIALGRDQEGWRLLVCDDGVGFDPEAQRERRSLGLESMRERVQLVNGKLTVRSAPGRGTEIVAWLPANGARE